MTHMTFSIIFYAKNIECREIKEPGSLVGIPRQSIRSEMCVRVRESESRVIVVETEGEWVTTHIHTRTHIQTQPHIRQTRRKENNLIDDSFIYLIHLEDS